MKYIYKTKQNSDEQKSHKLRYTSWAAIIRIGVCKQFSITIDKFFSLPNSGRGRGHNN